MVWPAIVVTYVSLKYEYWVIYNIPNVFAHLSILQKSWYYEKSGNLGRSLQFSASLSHLLSTTASSDTYDSITNCDFSTIINSTIIFTSQNFIWNIKTAYRIICCRETDCWTKTPWLYSANMANNDGKRIQLIYYHDNICTAKY